MQRIATFIYGTVVYGLFLAVFLYLIGFLAGFAVPKAINDGAVIPMSHAIVANVGLIALFAIQHTIMARPGFKRRLTRLGLPTAAERSTFVFATNIILASLMWFWQPIPVVLFEVTSPIGRGAIFAIAAAGWGIVLLSTFLINHFDLFGLRQVTLELRKRPYTDVAFVERWMYRVVRHPLLLGFMIAFWATPLMTVGHLTFAIGFTAYILVGIRFEERDLVRQLGPEYQAYRRRTPMLLPRPTRRPTETSDRRPAGCPLAATARLDDSIADDSEVIHTTVFLSESR